MKNILAFLFFTLCVSFNYAQRTVANFNNNWQFILEYNSSFSKEKINKEAVRPNILFIYTDQQGANMMSCAGNKWLNTPAMDYIAKNGIRFTRAYTPNPACPPAKIGVLTGRLPGYFKDINGEEVRNNKEAREIAPLSKEALNTNMASFLKKGGYELLYGGKEQLPATLSPSKIGFRDFSNNERLELAKLAAEEIKAEHTNPWFMMVSFVNPHDICYMAVRESMKSEEQKKRFKKGHIEIATLDKALKIPDGVSREDFFKSYCPPLPENYEPQFEEPQAIKNLLSSIPFRKNARENFTDEQWRMHRWAYCRLVEHVDHQIQIILDALKESGQEHNTIVMLSSDHGDMDASHRMEHKSMLYEEAVNVPFLAMWKGHIPAGLVNNKNLISNGLDVLPTVCDYIGVEGSADVRGRSLKPLFEGKKVDWRKTLGVESEIGKMVVDEDGFKYLRYDLGSNEEQLLDLNKDPFETTHFTKDADYNKKLNYLRKEFNENWFPN